MATRRNAPTGSRAAGAATRKYVTASAICVGDFFAGLFMGDPAPAPRKRSTKRKPRVTRAK